MKCLGATLAKRPCRRTHLPLLRWRRGGPHCCSSACVVKQSLFHHTSTSTKPRSLFWHPVLSAPGTMLPDAEQSLPSFAPFVAVPETDSPTPGAVLVRSQSASKPCRRPWFWSSRFASLPGALECPTPTFGQ